MLLLQRLLVSRENSIERSALRTLSSLSTRLPAHAPQARKTTPRPVPDPPFTRSAPPYLSTAAITESVKFSQPFLASSAHIVITCKYYQLQGCSRLPASWARTVNEVFRSRTPDSAQLVRHLTPWRASSLSTREAEVIGDKPMLWRHKPGIFGLDFLVHLTEAYHSETSNSRRHGRTHVCEGWRHSNPGLDGEAETYGASRLFNGAPQPAYKLSHHEPG